MKQMCSLRNCLFSIDLLRTLKMEWTTSLKICSACCRVLQIREPDIIEQYYSILNLYLILLTNYSKASL
uniref:Putative ovule protein n=1 Tax=Solanum chacoense TaxID=4108 RepID=A0A0V0H4K3_SOLCH